MRDDAKAERRGSVTLRGVGRSVAEGRLGETMGYDESLIQLINDTLIITLKIMAPILAAGIIVGLFISVLQSVTSIQEQTLTFVPKIFAMVLVAIVLIPWIVTRLVEFTAEMFTVW